MTGHPNKKPAARRAFWLLLIAAMSFSLLIWGKLQLKKVPRTAVADPDEVKVATPSVPADSAAPRRAVQPVEKSRPDQADGKN